MHLFGSYLLDIYLVLKCHNMLYWFSLRTHSPMRVRAHCLLRLQVQGQSPCMCVMDPLAFFTCTHTHFLTSSKNSRLPVALSHQSWPVQNKVPSKVQRKYQTKWSLSPNPSVMVDLFGFFSSISLLMLFSLCHLLCRVILLCLSLALATVIA